MQGTKECCNVTFCWKSAYNNFLSPENLSHNYSVYDSKFEGTDELEFFEGLLYPISIQITLF